MMVKFIGGSEDGKTRIMPVGSRIILVALRKPQTATIEDFTVIDLDEVWNGPSAAKLRAQHQVQRYRRTAYDREDNVATYEFDGMEE